MVYYCFLNTLSHNCFFNIDFFPDEKTSAVTVTSKGVKNIKIESTETRTTIVAKEEVVKKSPSVTHAFKKRHRGCSFCILDIDNVPLPEFPPNEKVVGVISMEDVIEELLQVPFIQFRKCKWITFIFKGKHNDTISSKALVDGAWDGIIFLMQCNSDFSTCSIISKWIILHLVWLPVL